MLTAYCLSYLIHIYIYIFLFDTQFSSDLHEYRDFGTPKIFIVTRYLFAFFCVTLHALLHQLSLAPYDSLIFISYSPFSLIILTGWGNSRFESNRPVSLQPDSISFTRVSAESSSESEAQSISSVSGVKGSKSKDERRSGMFRIFGRKGGDKEKEKEKDKRRSSQTPPQWEEAIETKTNYIKFIKTKQNWMRWTIATMVPPIVFCIFDINTA